MTKREEEIVRLIAQRILDQGGAAVTYAYGGGMCRYRTDDGKKCAVGGFIPDELYNPSIEGGSVLTLPQRAPKIWDAIVEQSGISDVEFWCKVQQEVHDGPAFRKAPLLTPDEAVQAMKLYLED